MSKTKASKGDSAKLSKKESKKPELASVKEGRVSKPAQTSKAKSKEIAKSAAANHVVREELKKKKKKKAKKAPEPEPEPESDSSESNSSDSEEDGSSDSSASGSEEEEVGDKAVAKTNGAVKPQAQAESDSDSSDASSGSSDSDSESESDSDGDEEATIPKANGVSVPAPKAGSNSSSESDSDGSTSDESESSEEESDEEKSAVKAKVNGAAKTGKAVKAKASESESSESSDNSDSDDSSASESEEEEAPSKKRKAEMEATPIVKKTKTESSEEGVKNLFVGNLSWNVDEEWLSREFEEFGEIVGCRVITDRETGRPKGFGYVEFASVAAAKAAKESKHEADLDGRPMNIDYSTPRQQGAGSKEKSFDRAKKFGDQQSPPSNTLFIGNISFNATNDMVAEYFQEYGTITRVSLPTDRESGAPKGFGYVDFTTTEEAKAALEGLNGADIAGRAIRIDYAAPRDGNSGQRGGFGGRGRGGDRGGRGGFGGRGGARGGARGGRGGTTNRGGFNDFKGSKMTF